MTFVPQNPKRPRRPGTRTDSTKSCCQCPSRRPRKTSSWRLRRQASVEHSTFYANRAGNSEPAAAAKKQGRKRRPPPLPRREAKRCSCRSRGPPVAWAWLRLSGWSLGGTRARNIHPAAGGPVTLTFLWHCPSPLCSKTVLNSMEGFKLLFRFLWLWRWQLTGISSRWAASQPAGWATPCQWRPSLIPSHQELSIKLEGVALMTQLATSNQFSQLEPWQPSFFSNPSLMDENKPTSLHLDTYSLLTLARPGVAEGSVAIRESSSSQPPSPSSSTVLQINAHKHTYSSDSSHFVSTLIIAPLLIPLTFCALMKSLSIDNVKFHVIILICSKVIHRS